MNKQYYAYILANYSKTCLYTGVTNNLTRRVYEHKHKIIKGFSSKYHTDNLVYFEMFDDINEAIKREKQIKGGSKQKKIDLIKEFNPDMKDLYNDIL